jgi:hypothetical protein
MDIRPYFLGILMIMHEPREIELAAILRASPT